MQSAPKSEKEQQVLNENPIIEMLLNKYYDIANQLNIDNVAVFEFHDDRWTCLFAEGTCQNAVDRIDVDHHLLPLTEIVPVSNIVDNHIKDVLTDLGIGLVAPIFNKSVPIAYLLLGRNDAGNEADRKGKENIDPVFANMLIQSISDVIIACIESLRLIAHQKSVKRELELAAHVQNRLIPRLSDLPRNRDLIVNAFYKPHYDVGGDYFDCIDLGDDKVGFCVADVSGKGIAAALLMSNFQATLRALFTSDIPMDRLIGRLNECISSIAQGNEFITLFIARYDCVTRQLEYVNCGHTTSILYGTDTGKLKLFETSCPGLGMLDELPYFEVKTFGVTEHSLMLNYTDGLVELLSGDNDEVLLTFDTILQLLRKSSSIDDVIGVIIREQGLNHTNNLIFDDVTLLGVEFLTEPPDVSQHQE